MASLEPSISEDVHFLVLQNRKYVAKPRILYAKYLITFSCQSSASLNTRHHYSLIVQFARYLDKSSELP